MHLVPLVESATTPASQLETDCIPLAVHATSAAAGARRFLRRNEDDRLRRADSERPASERVQPPDIQIVESAR